MKILILNDYGTPTAGAERLTLDLSVGLRERGHTVRVLTSRAQLIPGESFADTHCFGTNSRFQTLTSAVNISAARSLRAEIRAFQPDIVQVHMFMWQLSPSILQELLHVPAVYWAMTYKSVCPTGLKWLPSEVECHRTAGRVCLQSRCITPLGFVPLMLQRLLWRRRRSAFNAVVSCSNAVRKHLEADGIAVHGVIAPGVPLANSRPAIRGVPTVTFTGRLVHEKGVDVLLEAFRTVRDQLPTARLRIAGSGPLHSMLTSRIGELQLTAAVELCGQLRGDEIARLLDESWVHAVPSRWPEPFGLTATEAMMRGIPVVASNTGGLADIVEHGASGFLVPMNDVASLAKSLLLSLSDTVRTERMGAAARERALSHFTLDRCVTTFENLYAQLVGNGKQPSLPAGAA